MRMKRVFSRAVALLLVAALFTLYGHAAPSTSARSHILLDGNTGHILTEKNAHQRSLIASTTKIMTAVIVLESMDLSQTVKIPGEAVGIEGSSLYLKEGELLTVSDLLYGMMLHSGNDAAVVLAIACCGTVANFVDSMNRKALALSLQNTHFDNPNGLDGDTHYSTAYDLAVLTAYALKIPGFKAIVSSKTATAGTRPLKNHNRLLWMMDGIIGVKTGFTKAAGRILVSALDYHGRTMIAVTIHDGNDWMDHMSLYEYGKTLYTPQTLICKEQRVGELPMLHGGVTGLYACEELIVYALEGERPVLSLRYPLIGLTHSGSGLLDVYIGDLHIRQIPVIWEDISLWNDYRS